MAPLTATEPKPENLRVIAEALSRLDESVPAVPIPIGLLPTGEGLNLAGLDLPAEQLAAALDVEL